MPNTQNNQGNQNQQDVRQAGAQGQQQEGDFKNPYITTPAETAGTKQAAAKEGSRMNQPKNLEDIDDEQDERGLKARSSEEYGANSGRGVGNERELKAGDKNSVER